MTDTAIDILPVHYTHLYKNETSDSPDKSRTTLIRRIKEKVNEGISENTILNIGSGPQALEAQMLQHEETHTSLFKRIKIFTLDVANIKPFDLLVQKRDKLKVKAQVLHVQGSGFKLPYKDNSMGLVVSNHAIDFLDKSAFKEALRVLSPGGFALFNFHHPSMIPNDLENEHLHENVKVFWQYLKKNNILFDTPERIKRTMEEYGFNVNSINLNNDRNDKWWEVELTKPSNLH